LSDDLIPVAAGCKELSEGDHLLQLQVYGGHVGTSPATARPPEIPGAERFESDCCYSSEATAKHVSRIPCPLRQAVQTTQPANAFQVRFCSLFAQVFVSGLLLKAITPWLLISFSLSKISFPRHSHLLIPPSNLSLDRPTFVFW
jgi:hypothetical protein